MHHQHEQAGAHPAPAPGFRAPHVPGQRPRTRRGLRQAWAHLAAAMAVAMLLAACAPSEELSGEGGGDTDGPLKIGFVSTATGAIAAAGKDMRDGWNLYWKQHDGKAAGREVETIFEDDAGNPDTGLNKATRLVENEQVSMVVGPILANIGYVIADYVSGKGLPSIQAVAAADDLTQRKANPLVVRTGAFTSSQSNFAAGQWAYEQGHRTAVTLCPDYAFGHESCGGFVRTFTEAGGRVLGQLWNPLNTQDFSTYVNQMRQLKPDVLFVTATGADAPRFVAAYEEFGLKDTIPLLGNATLLEQAVLRSMGPAAEGLRSFGYFAEGNDTPATKKFVEEYLAEYGVLPSLYSAGAYVTAEWIAKTLERTEGDASDGEAFVKEMRAISFDDSALGPLRLDDHNQIVGNAYLRTVTKRPDGKLWNTADETIPDVSQFWTYDPEEYLKNPVYSREYQGAKQ
jgi:branched-chain amino acid transport system substrate-binding protein